MATIQDIPSSEAPATSRTKINDNFGALNTELIAATSAVAGKAATVHTHATSDVTGLDSALSGKASTSHTHAISDTTGLQSALDGKQASGSYAASSHTHAISDTTGLQTALDGKQASGSYAASSHTHATSEVTGLDSALSGKAATSHSHATSDVTGLDSALSGKAAASHTHATSEVTGLDAALAGKAASSHSHATSDVTGLDAALAGKAAATHASTHQQGGADTLVPALSAHTFASTMDIAFTAAPQRRSIAVTGNLTLTGSGYADGREYKAFFAGDTVPRTISFPSGWVFVGSKPTELAANKAAVFSLECTSGSESGVRCAWGVQT